MLQYPAALHATILLAASHLGKEQSSQSYTVDLPQLRSMAVREISKSLAVEARGVSDHLIAAVMQMASYEALFGEWSICDTHMRGLKQMVSLRADFLPSDLEESWSTLAFGSILTFRRLLELLCISTNASFRHPRQISRTRSLVLHNRSP